MNEQQMDWVREVIIQMSNKLLDPVPDSIQLVNLSMVRYRTSHSSTTWIYGTRFGDKLYTTEVSDEFLESVSDAETVIWNALSNKHQSWLGDSTG